MQQVMPELRGHPVGVISFSKIKGAIYICYCLFQGSQSARRSECDAGADALALCLDLKLVTQRLDLFRRANSALLNEIMCEIPIDVVKSIDELACQLMTKDAEDPLGLARRIKQRISNNIGPHIHFYLFLSA